MLVRSWEFLSEVLFSFVSKEGKLSAEGGGKRAYLKDSVELKRHKIAPVERERGDTSQVPGATEGLVQAVDLG